MLLAYTLYSLLLALVSNGAAEMTTFMPVSGGYIRLAGEWVDEAFGMICDLLQTTDFLQELTYPCLRLHGWLEFLLLRSFAHTL